MSYTKSTDFEAKDSLLSGNPAKLIKGVEIDDEFDAIQTADALNAKGAARSTDNAIARFDSTSGKALQNSAVTIDDSGNMSTAGTLVMGSAFGHRNKIIGGDFTTNPWQRGTTFTAPVTVTYVADRWQLSYVCDGVVNILKTADAPTVAQAGVFTQHCLHVDVTTADATIAAAQYYLVTQKIEGLNAASFGFGQAGTRYVTLSFWHKHTKTGTYCVSLANSAADRCYIAEYTQDVTDTWEQATVTLAVDTSGTWLYDTGVGLRIYFSVAMGSNFHTTANTWTAGNLYATSNQVNALDSTANNFKIALVQLEAGSVATPFETRPYGTELALCQRYYYRLNGAAGIPRVASGFSVSTTVADFVRSVPVTMRTAPSALEQSGTATDYNLVFGGTNANGASVPTIGACSADTVAFTYTTAAVMTLGQGCLARQNTNGYLGWSAEL